VCNPLSGQQWVTNLQHLFLELWETFAVGCDIYHAELIQQKHNNKNKVMVLISDPSGWQLWYGGQMCGSLQDAP